MPRQSRLFANEVLQGAPHISETIGGHLKALVDDHAALFDRWIAEGRMAAVDTLGLCMMIGMPMRCAATFSGC